MKVLPFKIPKPGKEALVYQEDREHFFYDKLHEHEEIQISYIVKGSGSLILGDTINEYQENDILIIGEHIPHVFRSDRNTDDLSIMYTLFFTKNSFGNEFFKLTDLSEIDSFFDQSEYGIKVTSYKNKLLKKFNKLKHQNRIERIANLLQILEIILRAEKKPLSSFVYHKKYTEVEGKRMSDVFQYTLDHFKENITLETIAEKANMSKNAFCRYFKKRTNKTFLQFLIELRIEYACKLLYKEKELPVAEVSERCGFQNIANFNRKFKEIKAMTPTQFRLSM
ncbi:AraC family transcriptional regulator [Leeuwenhoekiella sp. MAR_2009_132]|uniref:AraC family transcriptional regulator n=1 Tax=Leeuwenhoekiella sp. MAR_2009_132 TaxID=1392489 RepID=UPI00048BA28E|nr:AraC family transcriptional regulator [Leeuwenhoekiella sp. MAR_2009_132]